MSNRAVLRLEPSPTESPNILQPPSDPPWKRLEILETCSKDSSQYCSLPRAIYNKSLHANNRNTICLIIVRGIYIGNKCNQFKFACYCLHWVSKLTSKGGRERNLKTVHYGVSPGPGPHEGSQGRPMPPPSRCRRRTADGGGLDMNAQSPHLHHRCRATMTAEHQLSMQVSGRPGTRTNRKRDTRASTGSTQHP